MAIESINSPTDPAPGLDPSATDPAPGLDPLAESRKAKRPRRTQSEDEYLATCLVMLSRGSTSPPRSFSCTVCGRTFPSYQALGGHKGSHSVKAPSSSSAAVISSYVSALNPRGRVHECAVCHETFPSGQALGGHKRRHYEGVIGGGAPKSRTTSSNSGVVRNIDLNLPPSPELQCDEEVESAIR